MKNGESMVGKKIFDKDKTRVWTGLRPISPDDVPILGPITKYHNVFVSAGHGGKGLSASFGSAKLIQE